MKATKGVSARELSRKPILHPNSIPGMMRVGDLIYECEDAFKRGVPITQTMFDELWREFNNLWESVDKYMGHPPLPSPRQFWANMNYWKSLATEDHEMGTINSLISESGLPCKPTPSATGKKVA